MNEDVVTTIVTAIVLVAAGGGLLAWLLLSRRRRLLVEQNSPVLAELKSLNEAHLRVQTYHDPLRYELIERVASKAKYDRYDLRTYFLQSIESIETDVRHQIEARLAAQRFYATYAARYDRLAIGLGRSTGAGLDPARFLSIEAKLFRKRRLPQPLCVADVRCTVTYTSPQGQNSYARALAWDFEGLRLGIDEVRRIRDTRSTTQFLRQQERNKMTVSLRAQVLVRDGSRCRMCGRSVSDGVKLHVDHVIPVSKGGLTEPANLQTLCEDCNLGKSNRL